MSEYDPVNVAVLRGRLSRPATSRVLPSGDRLASFEVTVEQAGLRAETVPVVWFDAPASIASLDVGEVVVVVGRVRRRFFRAGDRTQSRTEVVAERVVPLRHEERARRALERAVATLVAAPGGSGGSAAPASRVKPTGAPLAPDDGPSPRRRGPRRSAPTPWV